MVADWESMLYGVTRREVSLPELVQSCCLEKVTLEFKNQLPKSVNCSSNHASND